MDSPPTPTHDDSSSGNARQAALDRLAEEFVERERRGEQPSISQYVREHPELAEGIEDIFPVLAAMEDARAGKQEADTPPRETLGDYRLLREIGRGGMGVVYEAEQRTLGRRVALKILPTRATLDPRFLERFRLEAQAAARLQHPNIVPVFGYGLDDGVHYFTMQYIEGRGLDAFIHDARERIAEDLARDGKADSSTLGPTWFQDVARIGLQAAEAIAHAHAHGVLHRDVKPGNLMLDANGKIWVTDFGLCKEEGSGDLTQPGDLLGTFRYMAPERFAGDSDVRGDIYGVGVTLYELLTRTPAYEDEDRATLAARILRETPKRPRQHDPRIPVDLERIVLKAMAHDPTQRYQTADALAADLRAYLEGRPIAARTPSLGYVVRVAVRRHRALALTLVAAAVLLVASSVYYVLSLRAKEADARFRHYVASIAAAETALRDRDTFVAKRLLDEAPTEHRNFEWYHLRSRLDRSLRDYPRRELVVERVAYSPNGAWLAAQSGIETRIYDVAKAELVARLEHGGVARGIAWNPRGGGLAVATGAGTEVWRWPEPKRLQRLQDGYVRAVGYSADGSRLATGGHDGQLRVRDAQTLEIVRAFEVHSEIYTLDFHPDGQRVVTGSWDGAVSVWRLEDGASEWSVRAQEGGVHGVAFAGSTLVAATAGGGVVKVWRASDGTLLRTLGHESRAETLCSSPDGRFLAVAVAQQIHIWDPLAGRRLATWLHDSEVRSVAFHPAGSRFAAASKRGSVKEWPLHAEGDPDLLGGHIDGTAAMDYAPSGRWIVTTDEGRVVRLWDAATGELARTWLGLRGGARCARFSGDSRRLVTSDHLGEVLIWNVAEGRVEHRAQAHPAWANAACFSHDDARVFSVGDDGMICVYDVATGERRAHVRNSDARTHALAVSANGRWVATGDSAGVVRIRDAGSLEVVCELRGHTEPVMSLAFQPGDRRLASASWDRTVRIWDAESGTELRTMRAHAEESALYPDVLRCVAFSPDGSRVAAGSHDASVMIWDTERGQLVATLRGYDGWVNAVAFSPDGESLVSAASGNHVRLSHTRPLRERLPQLSGDGGTRAAARRIVTELRAVHGDVDRVIAAIQAREPIDAAVQEAALRIAHRRRGTADALVARLWRMLLPRESARLDRKVALGIAQGLVWAAAHRSRQDSRRNTLVCLAYVRCGRPAAALQYLASSAMLNEGRHPALHAVDLAVAAMAHADLDQVAEATRAQLALDQVLRRDPTLGSPRVQGLKDEAREKLAAARTRLVETK